MMRLNVILLSFLAVLVIGGLGFVAIWDLPAPSSTIEKIISNDRFSR